MVENVYAVVLEVRDTYQHVLHIVFRKVELGRPCVLLGVPHFGGEGVALHLNSERAALDSVLHDLC